ncbi:MFS transporter [Brevibacterium casei]|nr:MFS transporter [Brevibacterium casei]
MRCRGSRSCGGRRASPSSGRCLSRRSPEPEPRRGDGCVPIIEPARTGARAGSALRRLFADRKYRAAVFGYVGHMWELYAFWAVVPVLALGVLARSADVTGIAAASFAVIAVGTLGCVLGGMASRRLGSARVAATALAGSGLMCLLFPLLPDAPVLLLVALVLWGFFVVADSPQFSELASRFAPDDLTGTGLTAMNAIGFAVSVGSIVLLQSVLTALGPMALWLLLPGPVLGLLAMRPLLVRQR